MANPQQNPLQDVQNTALDRLKRSIQAYIERNFPTPPARDSQAFIDPSQSHAEIGFKALPSESNVFCISGERGSGKSTLLLRLPDALSQEVRAPNAQIRVPFYIVPPIDCTRLPERISLGVAVLARLLEFLCGLEKNQGDRKLPANLINCEVAFGSETSQSREPKSINDLIGLHARTDEDYRSLCLDLSTTTDDYKRYSFNSVVEGIKLSDWLSHWLEQILECLQAEAFIVPLDDFDLTTGKVAKSHLRALLDEFHQPRLLFVLTADFPRLQRLGWSEEDQLDAETGRALIDKLIPPQNRTDLTHWDFKNCLGFRPFRRPGDGIKVSDRLNAGTTDERKDDRPDLEELLRESVPGLDEHLGLIASLLPRRPRGLENFYRQLEQNGQPGQEQADLQMERHEDNGQTDQGQTVRQMELHKLLVLLAACRSEQIWSNRIREARTVSSLLEGLDFPAADVSPENWDALVSNSANVFGNPLLLKPLRVLRPREDRTTQGGRRPSRIAELIAGSIKLIAAVAETGGGSHDHFRHEEMQRRTLRDAALEDVPLWTELLLDIGLNETPSTQVWLLEAWRPLRERLSVCRIQVISPQDDLRRLCEDDRLLAHQAALYWLESKRQGKTGFQIDIGWNPLLRALRRVRDPLSPSLLGKLLPDPQELAIKALPHHPVDHLFPGSVRGLILLVDALYRCPWTLLSLRRGWTLATQLCIAAALTRSAYLFAWCRSLGWDKSCVKSDLEKEFPEQWRFYRIIESRHPQALLHLNENDLVGCLENFFDEENPKTGDSRDKNPIAQARDQFVCSPVYTEVRKLSKWRAKDWPQREAQALADFQAPIDGTDAEQG